MKKENRNFPVLKGFAEGANLVVWCPFCKRWHRHGNMKDHRAPHCHNSDSGFDKTGYDIVPFNQGELYKIVQYANTILSKNYIQKLKREARRCHLINRGCNK